MTDTSLPGGVVPGETPGWPVDATTGVPLDLTDAQRAALASHRLEPQTAEGDGIAKTGITLPADGTMRTIALGG